MGALSTLFNQLHPFPPNGRLGSVLGQLTWVGIIGAGVGLALGGAPVLTAAGGALKGAFGAVAHAVAPYAAQAAPVLAAA